jgi:hypothetical protein
LGNPQFKTAQKYFAGLVIDLAHHCAKTSIEIAGFRGNPISGRVKKVSHQKNTLAGWR